jgi:hypothetical protein
MTPFAGRGCSLRGNTETARCSLRGNAAFPTGEHPVPYGGTLRSLRGNITMYCMDSSRNPCAGDRSARRPQRQGAGEHERRLAGAAIKKRGTA